MNEGWKCPVCGRGVAPTEKHCEHGATPTYPSTGPAPILIPGGWVPWGPSHTGDPMQPPYEITCGMAYSHGSLPS